MAWIPSSPNFLKKNMLISKYTWCKMCANVMFDLYLADIRSGDESAQSDLLLGGLLPI